MANDVSLILREVAQLDAKLDESLKGMSLSREQLTSLTKFRDSIKMFINKIRDSEKDLTKLISSDSMTVKELGNRFSALMDLLDLTDKKTGSLAQILNCVSSFKSSKKDFERVIKTVQMRLKLSGSDRDTFFSVVDILLENAKEYKKSSDDNVKLQGEILKYFAKFLKSVSVQISSVLSALEPDVLKPKRRAENAKRIEPGNIDDLSASAKKRLAKYWPEYWRVLSKYGTFGQKLDTENISKLKIFNYTDSGQLKVDSTSYTQGCVKNCYFMATLKTLSHTSGAQNCLRNCFDKMSDDDLQFKNEKSDEERLNKVLTVGFYRIDFDDMCVNTLKYLGTRAKGRGGEGMEAKPLAQKVYFKFTCKDLLAAGMINVGTELWPLILEHAWGMYLVDVSEQLAKRSSKLPCKFKKITDPTNEMPDIIDAEHGDFSIFSKFAENAYDSIALASITGKKAKIAPVDLSGGTKYDQWYLKLSKALRSGKVITAFNKHETEKNGEPFLRTAADKKAENEALRIRDKDGNPVSHTIALDAGGGEKVMLYQGHTISVLGCRLQGGECLLDCEDTMIDNGPNKGAFTLKLKQFVDHFDHITISSV